MPHLCYTFPIRFDSHEADCGKSSGKTALFLDRVTPIAFFVMHSLITEHLLADDMAIPVNILQDEQPWLESVGRYRFIAAAWFFGALAVLAAALLVRNLLRPMAAKTRVAATGTVLFIFLLVVTPTIQQHVTSEEPRIYHQVGGEVFKTPIARITAGM